MSLSGYIVSLSVNKGSVSVYKMSLFVNEVLMSVHNASLSVNKVSLSLESAKKINLLSFYLDFSWWRITGYKL